MAAMHEKLMLVVALGWLGGCPGPDGHDDDTAGTGDDDASEDDDTADDDDTGSDDDTGGDDDTAGDDDSAGAVCGDGEIAPPEVCDDGNTDPGDGCSADCLEKWIVTGLGVEGTVYDLARETAGTSIHLLWKDGPLQFGRLDEGQVVDVQTLPDSSQVNTRYTRPRLAVAPDGSSVHTTWFQGIPGEELYHAWSEGGGPWSREEAWSNGGAEHYVAVPAAGVDLTGTVHVVAQRWWFGPDGESQDESTIMALGKPAGGPWSAHTDIHSEAGKNWRDTSVYTDSAGGVHATWKSHSRPGKYRHAASGSDLTAGSTIDIPVPGGETTTSFGDTFVADDGTVHHAFFAYPGNTLWHAVREPGAASFGDPTLIAAADNDELTGYENPWPGIAVDSDGRVYVAWAENRGQASVPFVNLAQLSGGTWGVEALDTAAAIDAQGKPAITAVGKDVFVVWRAGSGELILAEIAVAGP